MKDEIKSRLILLSILLTVELVVAEIGVALGIGEVFRRELGAIKVTVNDGNLIITQRGGNKSTEIARIQINFTKDQSDKAVEIVLENETIRGLVGENYQIEASPKVELKIIYVELNLKISTY
jgi:hypothetical protein